MVDGKTFSGDGKRNEDYYCFGRPVLAPGDGLVYAVENNVEDNVPGELNPEQALGNYIIIDHANGEFSFLAHFRKGTVALKKGAVVRRGDMLGLCGNSGNTSEPHIHYHLQDSGVFQKGEGLPAKFGDYLADGKLINWGEPVRGQRIRRYKK
jgi:murein DD-endopeptidase MepM/ murein hydrolase activator NlpD